VIDVRVQAADFDPGRQLARLGELKQAAVASYTGLVHAAGEVEAIHVDHYPSLARTELGRLAEEAKSRWPLGGVILIHRHGRFAPCDRLAFAAAAAADSETAFAACAFLAEGLRTRAPFWRKELLAGGASRWR
jgi:molybdopterin synthase catalytic subunit